MIILFYGQPASGKTTLANALASHIPDIYAYLVKKKFNDIGHKTSSSSVKIDGDKWRDVTKNKDYSKEGRVRNLKGAFDMALYMEKEGYIPLLSFVTPYNELRNHLKENSECLVEIYLQYNQDRGRNMNFANDFELPESECLNINTSENSIDECLLKVIDYIKENAHL